MSPKDRLTAFGRQVGFRVSSEPEVVRAVGVPCVLKDGVAGACTIEKSCDPANRKPNDRVGGAVHAVRIVPDQAMDGCVYNADGSLIGNRIGGDGETWSNISIHKGSQGSPEEDNSARDVVHRYAKQIVGAAWAAGRSETAPPAIPDPFNIPNTFEARAGIVPVQDRIRSQRIAIIGLGGTGSHILDLVAKTPVREIHVLDDDHMGWHNFMRAPGAPTDDEIALRHKGCLLKVDYYYPKYASLREGIHMHPIRVVSKSTLGEFLSAHPIDFAFVCIDQLTAGDSARQDIVYSALADAQVPFIDSGVNITVGERAVTGAVTTSFYEAGSMDWEEAIPNAKVSGDVPGYRNVQLPEVKALAASLAVMEWRRRTGQYVSKSASFLHKFRLERPSIVTPG